MAVTKLIIFSLFASRCDGLKCHTCSYMMDHNGNEIGVTDPWCQDVDSNVGNVEEECFTGAAFCGTELIVDWMPNGEQIVKYQRGCRTTSQPGNSGCVSGSLTGMMYKDCVTTCDTDFCNNDNAVEDLFAKKDESGKPVEIACYSCSSTRDENGGIIDGKPECYTTPTGEESKRQCPIYANSACFKAKAIVGMEETHFKGCSSFDVAEDAEDEEVMCDEFNVQGVQALACKSACNGKDYCNELSVQGNGFMCYTCEVTFNQMGQLVGWGDMGCYQDLTDRDRGIHFLFERNF